MSMAKYNSEKFISDIKTATTEEEVKSLFIKKLDIKLIATNRNDLYCPQILFEFKYNKNLRNLSHRSAVISQAIYYIRNLKFGQAKKSIPPYICIADKSDALLFETHTFKNLYNNDDKYDWRLAPSSPDKSLIRDVEHLAEVSDCHTYSLTKLAEVSTLFERMDKIISGVLMMEFIEKKTITEENFESVFEYWNGQIGPYVKNGFKPSKYFISDIEYRKSHVIKEESKVVFQFDDDAARTKRVVLKDYYHFWDLFEKVSKPSVIRGILSKVDRISDDRQRRFEGEFFTPVEFATLGLEYIEKVAGKKWWKSGEYRLWDMAAGTGNLEYNLPAEAYPFLYLSTLHETDVEYVRKMFRGANCFQYDYLNDDAHKVLRKNIDAFDENIEWKLPKNLRNDLKNPKIKWIILINPPFATSQVAGASGDHRADVSNTVVRKYMHADDLGEVSRELFSQFIYRIGREFKGKHAHLAMFSKIKYINSNNDQKLRDNVFNFNYERGFIFSSKNFSGTSNTNQFPVGFLIWDLLNHKPLDCQSITVDVMNSNVEKIGEKLLKVSDRSDNLNNWIKRTKTSSIFPAFSSSINIKIGGKDVRNRIADGFLASMMCKGNDLQNQNYVSLLSGPYVSAGAFSITKDNFEQAVVIFAARKAPQPNWINDRNQFFAPTTELSREFILDCAIYTLFHIANETVSLGIVEYMGEKFDIKNNMFPILLAELKNWNISDLDIRYSTESAEDRFAAKFISGNIKHLSTEARSVLNAAKLTYKFFYENSNIADTISVKLKTWDAGFWQIRKSFTDNIEFTELLADLDKHKSALRAKILASIHSYGIFDRDMDKVL